ncbi:anti-sigma factor domain-containing protein [Fodinicola acaciae]|uniref:anti-sigma factor n=1 Tax=Fodinicola acaciae TaxID=2681555 RepID=UPI0013D71263|nr:anti-sigma factor [Fodinicola acaciae]
MTHQEFDELAAGYALHALDPEDETRFRDHLETCADCRRTVDDLSAVAGELAYAAPQVDPPAELRDRIQRAVVVRQLPARRRLPWLLTAAAVVVAVLLGGWNVVLQQQNAADRQATAELVRQLGRPGGRLATLSTPSGQAVAYVLATGGKLQVVTDDLAANRTGSYWLWRIAGASPEPVGRFDVTGAGLAVHKLDVPVTDAAAYAVSLEPGQARPAKPTKVIANGTVDR